MTSISIEVIHLEEIASTNTYLKSLIEKNEVELSKLFTVVSNFQTGGRGQRGNTWLSEKGKNLTISILLKPKTIAVSQSFYISQLASLCVARTIANYLDDKQKELLSVKWPNDIYFGEKKIAGILIENSFMGDTVQYSIVGIGLNVNQETFSETLAQAISLKQITSKEYDLEELLSRLHSKFEDMYEFLHNNKFETIHRSYMKRLYRREGLHLFSRPNGEKFKAEIIDVKPCGSIVLRLENGQELSFAFKEIIFDVE